VAYNGRHHKPSNTGRNAARLAIVGVTAATPIGLSSVPASAEAPKDIANAIIACESGGNPTIQNSHSTASGLFQFINGTWKAYGGTTARAKDASVAEQWRVFERAYAAQGTVPWNASKSCWSRKIGNAPSAPRVGASVKAGPVKVKVKITGRGSDGRGSYVCDAAHYQFAACDPGDEGQVKQYPKYSRR
jgi:hypothetical protein